MGCQMQWPSSMENKNSCVICVLWFLEVHFYRATLFRYNICHKTVRRLDVDGKRVVTVNTLQYTCKEFIKYCINYWCQSGWDWKVQSCKNNCPLGKWRKSVDKAQQKWRKNKHCQAYEWITKGPNKYMFPRKQQVSSEINSLELERN